MSMKSVTLVAVDRTSPERKAFGDPEFELFHDARRSGRSSLVDAERDAGDANKDVGSCARKVVAVRWYQRRTITDDSSS
ncbi:hypothetical protein 1 [Diadegma semiclausum ichnovirus]|nr:hypothetical protein 1 [Diadegma semiclausum ichnovirus]